jgi:hypothetical protein
MTGQLAARVRDALPSLNHATAEFVIDGPAK